MKRRLIAVTLIILLIVASIPVAHGSGSICFIGINDSVPMYLSAAEAPYYKGGSLYVPYTVFNAGAGGVAVSYNAEKGSLALFTRAKRLVYDLNAGTVTDEAQRVTKVDFAFKNGILFIPATKATSHFGLTATMLTSLSGNPVLRLTDGSQQLDNNTFIRKAETLIDIILESEEGSSNTSPGQPGNDEGQTPSGPATVYVAVAGDAVSEQSLNALIAANVRAVFFLTSEQILQQRDLVRKIYAAGHQIGLAADANADPEQTLQAANEALDQVLFHKTLLVLLSGGTSELPQYAVFREWGSRTNVESALENTQSPQLLVCRGDVHGAVQKLRQTNAYMPQLMETSQIPGVSTK